jgi:serine/threonine-protein kinase RsbW
VSKITIYFPNVSLPDLAEVRRLLESSAVCLGAPGEAMTELVYAVNEAVTNVVVHGYQGQTGHIILEVSRADSNLVVCVQDQARSFDPTAVPSPDITLPLEQRLPGGLGVHLMRQFTDQMQCRARPAGGNELRLVKHIKD